MTWLPPISSHCPSHYYGSPLMKLSPLLWINRGVSLIFNLWLCLTTNSYSSRWWNWSGLRKIAPDQLFRQTPSPWAVDPIQLWITRHLQVLCYHPCLFFRWSIWIKDVIWLDLANMSSNLFFSWLIWIETLLKMRSDRILDIQIRHPIYSLYHQWINNGRSIVVVVVVGWKWLFSFVKSVSEHFIWIETLLKMWSFWILDCANPSSNRASLSSVDKQWATQRWLYLFEKTMQIAFYWPSKDMNNVNVALRRLLSANAG